MKGKWHIWALIGIFLLVFASRAYIATQSNLFSDDDSYFTLREVESISSTGTPLIYDPLSFGGRTLIFSPLFYYLLAGVFVAAKNLIALKIFTNLLASTVVVAGFLIAYELSKSRKIALLTAFISGFIPIYYQETVNSLSIYSLTLPLTFFSIYYLMMINKDRKYYTHFLVLLSLLIISSPTSIIFVLGILFFLVLAKLEKIELSNANIEILIVSTFFYLWLHFLLYKKAILFHGPAIIWQNIPKAYLYQYFSDITILQAVYLIGIVPFVLGTYTAYVYVTQEKSLNLYIIIGCASSLFLLLWFKLIPFMTGLMFLGGFLVLLISQYFKSFYDYIKHTKFLKFEAYATIGFILLIIASSAVPSVILGLRKLDNTPKKDSLDAYSWLQKNKNPTDVVLSSEKEGHALAYFAGVKTVMDDNFLLVSNIDQRLSNVERIYKTRFVDEALTLSSNYDVTYIMVDNYTRQEYGVDDLFYSNDYCVYPVYTNPEVKIYKITCGEGK